MSALNLTTSTTHTSGSLAVQHNSDLPEGFFIGFPEDMLLEIMNYLTDPKDIAHFEQTCRITRKLIRECHPLRTATFHLIEFTVKRPLLAKEASSIGVVNPIPNDALNNSSVIQENEEEITKFFLTFKQNCRGGGVDFHHAQFGHYVNCAKLSLTSSSKGNPISLLKMDTAIQGICKRIYVDIVTVFTEQPAASVTIESYKDTAIHLKSFFPNNTSVEIEFSLRQALKAKNDQAFNALAQEFLNVDPANAKVAELKAKMKTRFEAEKHAIENEIAPYSGPNGWNSSINQAILNLDALKVRCDAARTELTQSLGFNISVTDDQLAAMLTGPFTVDITTKRDAWLSEVAEFNNAKQANPQAARLAELAQYDINGAVVGGKLAQVNANLQDANLGTVARAEATKIGNFYRELNLDVTTANKAARYSRMHTIIGN